MKRIRIISLLVVLLLPLAAYGQVVPDNDDIFARTVDSESPYNYPALMLRYNAGDTSLTLADYHYLYYGYAFTDQYEPLRTIPAEAKLMMVLEANDKPTYDDMLKVIGYGQEVMKSDPFSPKNLNFLTYAYGAIGDTLNEAINHDRMTKVMATIENSGNGMKESSPMHILMFTHADDILHSRGYTVTNRRVVSKTVEFISVERNDDKVKGCFFDYSRIYWQAPSEEMPKRESRWKINDYPL